jgi:hypothetical protein
MRFCEYSIILKHPVALVSESRSAVWEATWFSRTRGARGQWRPSRNWAYPAMTCALHPGPCCELAVEKQDFFLILKQQTTPRKGEMIPPRKGRWD